MLRKKGARMTDTRTKSECRHDAIVAYMADNEIEFPSTYTEATT